MKQVTVLGLGMGNPDTLTLGAQRALQAAQLLVGAQRLLDALPESLTAPRIAATRAEAVLDALQNTPGWQSACVVLSGDIGLFSGAAGLLAKLAAYRVECLPGVSSVQYLAAKLGRPWQTWRFVSAHGLSCNAAEALLAAEGPVFFATGGQNSPASLCAQLCKAGLGHAPVAVGQRLSYPDETIVCGPAEEMAGQSFDPLSVLLAEAPGEAHTREAALASTAGEAAPLAPWPHCNTGLPDELFQRGKVPMTKQEVRAAALAKLRVSRGDTLYDIGAGTGSVAVELALLAKEGRVYAIERGEEATGLIGQNARYFGLTNLQIIAGDAPPALAGLPAPDAAYIGGSGGQLKGILEALLRKNPKIRLCVACVTLETLAEASRLLNTPAFCQYEACQIAVCRSRKAGAYQLMQAQNPVFLLSAVGAGL